MPAPIGIVVSSCMSIFVRRIKRIPLSRQLRLGEVGRSPNSIRFLTIVQNSWTVASEMQAQLIVAWKRYRRLVSTKGETGNAVNVLTFYGLCDKIRNVNQSKQGKIDNRAV